MLRGLSIAVFGLSLSLLSACGGKSNVASMSETAQQMPTDPTPITGKWCVNNGKTFTISATQLRYPELDCDVMSIHNIKGTYTLALVCTRDGVPASENATITFVGEAMQLTFLSKGMKTIIANRCGEAKSAPVAPSTQQSQPGSEVSPEQLN